MTGRKPGISGFLLLVIFICASLHPLFWTSQALAASTVIVEQSNIVVAAPDQSTGVIKVIIPKSSVPLAPGSQMSISWPSDIGASNLVPGAPVLVCPAGAEPAGVVSVSLPASAAAVTMSDLSSTVVSNSKFSVSIKSITDESYDIVFYINFKGMDCSNYNGYIPVDMISEPGGQFTTRKGIIVGNVKKEAGTNAVSRGIVQIGSAGGAINGINIFENARGAIKDPRVMLEIMTEGVTWGQPSSMNNGINVDPSTGMPTAGVLYPVNAGGLPVCGLGEWAWSDIAVPYQPVAWVPVAGCGTKTITISPMAGLPPNPAYTGYGPSGVWTNTGIGQKQGWIELGTLDSCTSLVDSLRLEVDEKVVRSGTDVQVKIKNAVQGGGITEQVIVVAKYVDSAVKVTAGTTTEVQPGKADQAIGDFYIEESIPGAMQANRSILLTLPEGVRWDVSNLFSNNNYEIVNISSFAFQEPVLNNYYERDPESMNGLNDAGMWRGIDGGRVLRLDIRQSSAGARNGAKIKLKKLKVLVSPSYSGSITIEVSGSAGVSGSVTVASSRPALTMTAVDNLALPALKLGQERQACSDVVLKETLPGSLASYNAKATEGVAEGQKQWLRLGLEGGYYKFAEIPQVRVTSGDIQLGQAILEAENTILAIPINKASSVQPATISISGISLNVDRNAPLEDVRLNTAQVRGNPPQCLDSTNVTGSYGEDRAAIVAIARMNSAPPLENENGVSSISLVYSTFIAESYSYTANGVPYAVDAAPYIRDGRMFVPMRYLAAGIGCRESDVLWSQPDRTITVTRGGQVAVFKVGSTKYTVDGIEKEMDVEPEITGDRVYMPARGIADAFGLQVTWEPGARMVVIAG